jgi:hypothetical protein
MTMDESVVLTFVAHRVFSRCSRIVFPLLSSFSHHAYWSLPLGRGLPRRCGVCDPCGPVLGCRVHEPLVGWQRCTGLWRRRGRKLVPQPRMPGITGVDLHSFVTRTDDSVSEGEEDAEEARRSCSRSCCSLQRHPPVLSLHRFFLLYPVYPNSAGGCTGAPTSTSTGADANAWSDTQNDRPHACAQTDTL